MKQINPKAPTKPMTEAPSALREAVLAEALTGLQKPAGEQKTLTPWLFYDEAGSQLFDQITELPEYYLTRTERSIFLQLAETLPQQLPGPITIAELGAGSAGKTGVLLQAFAASRPGDLLYQPIDISPSALEEAAASLAQHVPGVRVAPQVANYITESYAITRPTGHLILALYIGSSIGNFSSSEAVSILQNLRSRLAPGDFLLLGVDLAPSEHKSVATLLAAYDDAAGVTAAFNKNILTRLNRDLDANFDLDAFAHRARWNPAASRIEMHLETLTDQIVTLDGHKIPFAAGETIHTENSYKFTQPGLAKLLAKSGFTLDQPPASITTDPNHRFAVALAQAN